MNLLKRRDVTLLDVPRLRPTLQPEHQNPLFPPGCEYSTVMVKRGASILHVDETPYGVIYVSSGLLKTFRVTEHGREIAVTHIAPGEVCCITIVCMLGGACSPVDAVAMEDTEVSILPRKEFDRVYESSLEARRYIAEMMVDKTKALINRLEETAFLPMRVRLERFLQRYYKMDNGVPYVGMTHDEIARALGTAREVVSRLLLDMAAAGRVELRRGKIHLLAPLYVPSDNASVAA